MATILIAEDELNIAAFVNKGLQRAGYHTQIATDGQTALAMALSEPFDLVLLDLGLPVIDGWSVLAKIRTQSNQPPIIIVTALDGIEERHQSLSLGAADYITKPFRFSQLLASVRRHLP
ncbi:MAG: response regulator transcription factor [Cyanothece sp. SIO1E1]|nr:response regulator transcription factor [Cyanothece sp. SIO1E1]